MEVALKQLLADNKVIKVVAGKDDIADKQVTVSDIYRPGLELTGYFDFYPSERIQLLGKTEISYAAMLDPDQRERVFKRMCKDDTPCFLISRGLPIPEELLDTAQAAHIPVLRSNESTTYLSGLLVQYLQERLAERTTIHGVLVEIKGMGILLKGKSGVGKSETALALVQRGHRLIADDRVDVYRPDHETVIGEAPKILKHLMEIRGIGIIDIMNLFGAGAVKDSAEIQLVINLVDWNPNENYDRLGTEEKLVDVCGAMVPQITIPVKVGRNIEIAIEVAAMNFRAKLMGFDAAQTFDKNLTELIADNSKKA
ncbi:MAG: HPr(Ser) kinase/phosphatase [Lactobacillus sp.]|nr:HPr(Ser) kinase/phosphatase [Lactobacillus sp.]